MEPVLKWLDFTAADRDKMRRVLDLFDEKATVDELGLGTLRDALANALFPGTSSIQTRLRYVLFVPWIYQALERNNRIRSSTVASEARKVEVALIEALRANEDDEGLIGRLAKGALRRLPSTVYWVAVVRWGIFSPGQSQSWYHAHFDAMRRGGDDARAADDPGVVFTRKISWHPGLPKAPSDFPKVASFQLTPQEAEFVRGRIEDGCAGTLLAHLAASPFEPANSFWGDAAVESATPTIRANVELARRFSLHVEGAPLLYNLMLAEALRAKQVEESIDTEERIEHYRAEIAHWASSEGTEQPFAPEQLWAFMAHRGDRVPDRQKNFVETWAKRTAEVGPEKIADDPDLRRLIAMRETQLKGVRARLTNHSRLLDWKGSVGVGRMNFRWSRVRAMLRDLQAGLVA
ncbi:MAG: hypothetical protein HC927_01970 [Deltaproteobacteria bacterium]|nr:hypothetical protein [Deltaproteobacteria bacterium]